MQNQSISNAIPTQDLSHYVENLELEEPKKPFEVSKDAEPGVPNADEEQSFIAAKSLVSFVSGVSVTSRQDVLDSILLAQMAANKAFPNESDVVRWYEKFIEVLTTIGWVVEEKDFQNFKSGKDVFEVDNAIITILTTAFGSTFMPVIIQTLKSIKELSNNKRKILAFEKNTHSQKKGAFQIGMVEEKADTLAMRLGTFLISTKKEIKQILFFTSSDDETDMEYYSRKMTLNRETYAPVREKISQKIGDKVVDFVAEIEL